MEEALDLSFFFQITDDDEIVKFGFGDRHVVPLITAAFLVYPRSIIRSLLTGCCSEKK